MNLFDDIDRERREHTPNVYSGFVLLNRDVSPEAQHLRNRLESWFEKFPASSKKDVRARFRSIDVHEGALFELFLHELMIRLGCTVEVHPQIMGSDKNPDFLVCHGDKGFYLEATGVGQRVGPFTHNNNEQDVIDKLRTLCSPQFNLGIETTGTLSRTLSLESLVPQFRELLTSHDPDIVKRLIDNGGPVAGPSAKYESDGWSLEAWLIPISRSYDQTRQISVVFMSPRRTNSVEPVRKTLRKKSSKYGSPDLPLVVAVHTRDAFYNGRENDLEVLFGNEQISYSGESSWLSRKANGVWSRDRGDRIAAFLRCGSVDGRDLSRASVCIYVNPRRDEVALPDAIFRLSHGKVTNDCMIWSEGEEVAQLLDAQNH